MIDLNRHFFLLLNASDNANPLVLGVANLIAVYGIAILPVKLVLDWLRGTSADRQACLAVFGAVLFAIAINQAIGTWIYIPRPAEAGIGHSYLDHAPDSSFPSDHATVLFAAALGYAFTGRLKSANLMVLIGLVVSWARIYLGVHFPMDIAGAALVGLVAAGVIHATMRVAGQHLTDRTEALYRRLFSRLIARGWAKP